MKFARLLANIAQCWLTLLLEKAKKLIKTDTQTVKKIWHGGCKLGFNGEATTEGAAGKNKKRSKKMNGLIKQTKLESVSSIGALTLAVFAVALAFYTLIAGAGGSIA